MIKGDVQPRSPGDHLGTMFLLSLACHLALLAGLLYFFSRSGPQPVLTPSYTVDLVSLPAPTPATPGLEPAPAAETPPTPKADSPEVKESAPEKPGIAFGVGPGEKAPGQAKRQSVTPLTPAPSMPKAQEILPEPSRQPSEAGSEDKARPPEPKSAAIPAPDQKTIEHSPSSPPPTPSAKHSPRRALPAVKTPAPSLVKKSAPTLKTAKSPSPPKTKVPARTSKDEKPAAAGLKSAKVKPKPRHPPVSVRQPAPSQVKKTSPLPATAKKPVLSKTKAAARKSPPRKPAVVQPPSAKAIKLAARPPAASSASTTKPKNQRPLTAQTVAKSDREQTIQESIQGVKKGLAQQARNQAYRDAVAQLAAKLKAGKVRARWAGTGSRISTTTGASPAAGARPSRAPAISQAYMQQVGQLIRRHWQPRSLQRSNLKALKAVIIVRILADGTVAASWFEEESGDRLYDQSAMSAVTRTNPFPPLPPGEEQLEIGITFTPEWKASS